MMWFFMKYLFTCLIQNKVCFKLKIESNRKDIQFNFIKYTLCINKLCIVLL